jgi:hypothetical protein
MIYLASPYSHTNAAIMHERYAAVCRAAAALIKIGHHIYSPIAHTKVIGDYGHLPQTDFEFWRSFDEHMIGLSESVWILTIDGWCESVGIQSEFKIARRLKKPLYAVIPTTLQVVCWSEFRRGLASARKNGEVPKP